MGTAAAPRTRLERRAIIVAILEAAGMYPYMKRQEQRAACNTMAFRIERDHPEILPQEPEGLRAALESWVDGNPWERVGPADGESAVWDDPWRCYACGTEMPYTGDSRPPFDDRKPGPDDGEHDPQCRWLVSRRLLQGAD